MARTLTYIWGALILGVLALWVTRPDLFSEAVMASTLQAWGAWSLAGYVALSLFRGMVLVPSTPVVLAGGILFPQPIWTVLVVSMLGIVLSATLLYWFPGYGGYDVWLESKHRERLAKLRGHLVKPHAKWFVALWAFFPAAPTDLICYTAGLVRLPFRSMILRIIVAELPLVSACVLLGHRMAGFLAL